MVVGINSLLILLLVRHVTARAVGGLGTALLFFAATGWEAFWLVDSSAIRRWGRCHRLAARVCGLHYLGVATHRAARSQ